MQAFFPTRASLRSLYLIQMLTWIIILIILFIVILLHFSPLFFYREEAVSIIKKHNITEPYHELVYSTIDYNEGKSINYNFKGGLIIKKLNQKVYLYTKSNVLELNENFKIEWGNKFNMLQFCMIKLNNNEIYNFTSTSLFHNYKLTANSYLTIGGNKKYV